VGRTEELALLRRLLADSACRGIVLSGAPGVGKTRLAGDFARSLETDGWVVHHVRATEAIAAIPFGAFAHLVRGQEGTSPLDLLRRTGRSLAEEASGRSILLLVDDAHLLDASSAALLHHLVMSETAFSLLTVRAGTHAPEPIPALLKDEWFGHIPLQALSEGEVGELIAAALGGRVDGHTEHALWRASDGNGLFLRELLTVGLDTAALVETNGIWRWKGALTAPPHARRAVTDRLTGLDPSLRDVVDLVALSEPLELLVLASLVTPETVDLAEHEVLIVVDQSDRRAVVRLPNALYGEVIRDGLPQLRSRQLRRRLADAIDATGSRRSLDVLRVALLRLDAGDTPPLATLLAAARTAQGRYDHGLATRLAAAALGDGGGGEAADLLAQELRVQGRYTEAEEVLAAASTGATTRWSCSTASWLRSVPSTTNCWRRELRFSRSPHEPAKQLRPPRNSSVATRRWHRPQPCARRRSRCCRGSTWAASIAR
jgi:hypothetical protein